MAVSVTAEVVDGPVILFCGCLLAICSLSLYALPFWMIMKNRQSVDVLFKFYLNEYEYEYQHQYFQ